ncbi:MAG: hypothetical protein NUW00_04030 [Candidatus Kaiserbacteria bacterium]|nr:hypothetical protein [Candidatus Kaiserbacteria bacterium]
MSSQQDLWDYATAVFSLPSLRIQAVSRTLGSANIDAILATASDTVADAVKRLGQVQKTIDEIDREPVKSHLLIEEVRAEGARSGLILRNMTALISLLNQLRADVTESKFVLPQFRGVKHFEIGDEIMIYVGVTTDNRKAIEYDWISAKMLCPGWDWVMHCHSNVPWTHGGSNGGHYFRTVDQDTLFKRSDFYGLRRMLEQHEDDTFTNLLPAKLAQQLREGTVEPLTDEELAASQVAYIKRAAKVVDFYAQHVPIIAERYGIAA